MLHPFTPAVVVAVLISATGAAAQNSKFTNPVRWVYAETVGYDYHKYVEFGPWEKSALHGNGGATAAADQTSLIVSDRVEFKARAAVDKWEPGENWSANAMSNSNCNFVLDGPGELLIMGDLTATGTDQYDAHASVIIEDVDNHVFVFQVYADRDGPEVHINEGIALPPGSYRLGCGASAKALYYGYIHAAATADVFVTLIAAPPCAPDLDGNQTLDLFDFLVFVNLFNAQDPAADCSAEGVYDLFDFLCYLNAFNAGC